jgi:hypothetical protein
MARIVSNLMVLRLADLSRYERCPSLDRCQGATTKNVYVMNQIDMFIEDPIIVVEED